MTNLQIEFTGDTLVYTEQGVERLADLLQRPMKPCLWAIKWTFEGIPNGISFHKSHKAAREFAALQLDSVPDGSARLITVSQHIYDCVAEHGYCWTNLNNFEEAETYEGDTWKSH